MDPASPPTVIVGRVARRLNNALTMTFNDGGGGAPIATSLQCAGNGFGKQVAMFFGLSNHGPGLHVTTLADGTKITTASEMRGESVVSREGRVIARAIGTAIDPKRWGFDYSTIIAEDDTVLYGVVADPDRPNTMSLHCMLLQDPHGETVGWLDVVLGGDGWGIDVGSLGLPGVLGDLANLSSIHSSSVSDLPIVMKGTRLVLKQPPTVAERDILLGICVDLAICGRNYTRWDQSVREPR